jgi:hypothetical protein
VRFSNIYKSANCLNNNKKKIEIKTTERQTNYEFKTGEPLGVITRCSRDSYKRRHEKLDLHCLAKFGFCVGNLNLTNLRVLRMDGNFGCVH